MAKTGVGLTWTPNHLPFYGLILYEEIIIGNPKKEGKIASRYELLSFRVWVMLNYRALGFRNVYIYIQRPSCKHKLDLPPVQHE